MAQWHIGWFGAAPLKSVRILKGNIIDLAESLITHSQYVLCYGSYADVELIVNDTDVL